MPDREFARIEQQLFAASCGRMRVFGIRRTGQHAIINWILRNAGQENTVFLNSCTMRRSAVRTCGQSELNARPFGKSHRLKAALEAYLTPEKHPFTLVSYEAGYHEGALTPHFPDESFTREVLVTRSFVNWLPSFLRLMRVMNPQSSPTALEISNGVVFEMMRYKAQLLAAEQSPHVVVCFDQWAASPAYRLEKLAALGLRAIDNGLGVLQPYGAGSSFAPLDTPAEELALGSRWKTMAHDPFSLQFLRLAKADPRFMATLARRYPEDQALIDHLLA